MNCPWVCREDVRHPHWVINRTGESMAAQHEHREFRTDLVEVLRQRYRNGELRLSIRPNDPRLDQLLADVLPEILAN